LVVSNRIVVVESVFGSLDLVRSAISAGEIFDEQSSALSPDGIDEMGNKSDTFWLDSILIDDLKFGYSLGNVCKFNLFAKCEPDD